MQALLVHYTYFHVDFFGAGMFLLWISLALALWSAAEYCLKLVAVLRTLAEVSPSQRFDKRRVGG